MKVNILGIPEESNITMFHYWMQWQPQFKEAEDDASVETGFAFEGCEFCPLHLTRAPEGALGCSCATSGSLKSVLAREKHIDNRCN